MLFIILFYLINKYLLEVYYVLDIVLDKSDNSSK